MRRSFAIVFSLLVAGSANAQTKRPKDIILATGQCIVGGSDERGEEAPCILEAVDCAATFPTCTDARECWQNGSRMLMCQDNEWVHDYVDRDLTNGTFEETFDALVTSDGATITLSLKQAGGGDLTMHFSDGDTILDTDPTPKTITLTAGSDTAPGESFIYIPQSTLVLTESTSSWPATEHIKVSYNLVPSASFVNTSGVYINQNWNDHLKGLNEQGHLAHIAERARRTGAEWHDGVDPNGTDGYLTPTASNVELKATSGSIYQMHLHVVDAFDTSGSDEVLVVNWPGTPYNVISNLFDITQDSTGATIGNNKWFNISLWAVANKTGEYSPWMINLPGGFYNSQSGAEADLDGFDDFSMPAAFNAESSTGFLVARVTIQMKTTWVVGSTADLRKTTPSSASGSTGASISDFPDSQFTVFNVLDISKVIAFDASGITTGNTRTLTAQDSDGTIAYLPHTTDTGPSPDCSGTLTYQDGEAGCDTYTLGGSTTELATITGAKTSGDCVEFDASGNVIASGAACGGDAAQAGTLFTQIATGSVDTTVSAESIIGTTSPASGATLAADFFTEGMSVKGIITGELTRVSGTFTLRLNLGGTTVVSLALGTVQSGGLQIRIETELVCRADGATGDVFGSIGVTLPLVSGTGPEIFNASGSDLSIDTTGTLLWDVTLQPTISSASNGITTDVGIVSWNDPTP